MQFVANAVRCIEANGSPPKGKHWITKRGVHEDDVTGFPIRTVYKNGMLRINRDPNVHGKPIKDGKFNITCGFSGLRITAFGTKHVAKAFVDRIGPVWEKLFVGIWASEGSEFDERLYLRLASVGRLFAHDDMGEDDGDLLYEMVRPKAVMPASWFYDAPTEDNGIGECGRYIFGGHCALVRDGSDGSPKIWVMRGYFDRSMGLFLGNEKRIVWLRFIASETGTPRVEEHAKLKSALMV